MRNVAPIDKRVELVQSTRVDGQVQVVYRYGARFICILHIEGNPGWLVGNDPTYYKKADAVAEACRQLLGD